MTPSPHALSDLPEIPVLEPVKARCRLPEVDADDIRHISLLRELIEDATARIGELEARKIYRMSRDTHEALEDEIEGAKRELAKREKALLEDHGLTYEDGIPELKPITANCKEALEILERLQREFRGAMAVKYGIL